jgi:hypothetical protein
MKGNVKFLLYIVLVTSCVSEKTRYDGAILIHDPVKVNSIAYNDSRYFAHCKAIKLELSEESLIGEISQLEVSDELIYVLDKKTVTLRVFDYTGKYLRSIGRQGNGPGEYLAINAFYLNNFNHTVNVFDPLKLSVHQYDFHGNFTKSVKINNTFLAHIVRATPLDSSSILCFTNPNWHSEAGYFILNEKNYSLQKQVYQFPVQVGGEISYSILNHPYSFHGNEVHFVSLFSNVIHSYTNEKSQASYYIDNGKMDMNSNYLKLIAKTSEDNYIQMISKIIEDKKYTPGLKNIYETERYICVDFFGEHLLLSAILWDKKESVGCYIDEYYTYTPDFGTIIYCFDNTLVRVWGNSDVQTFKTNLKSGETTGKYPQELLAILDQYDEEDNPILLFYTMQNE